MHLKLRHHDEAKRRDPNRTSARPAFFRDGFFRVPLRTTGGAPTRCRPARKRPRRSVLRHARTARRRPEVPNNAAVQSNTIEDEASFRRSYLLRRAVLLASTDGNLVLVWPEFPKSLPKYGTAAGPIRFQITARQHQAISGTEHRLDREQCFVWLTILFHLKI